MENAGSGGLWVLNFHGYVVSNLAQQCVVSEVREGYESTAHSDHAQAAGSASYSISSEEAPAR